jgi:RND family efflux transporter MFP subunit
MGAASGRGSVVTLADLQHLEVETDVPEGMLSIITPGQPAEVSVSAVPGKRYNGRLRTIIPMGDRAKGTVKVQVEILDPDEHLFPDLVGTVNFLPNKESEQNATQEFLFVERTAIQEIGGKSYAWVVKTDNSGKTLERREVEVLSSGDARARVERGLSAGEEVVLNPTENLKPGERVKITD